MPIPLLPFGRTGHMSTRLIFGAAALSRVSQDVADQALEVLLTHEINHIDVAASYGDAELRVAPWLKRYPDRFFLATKTGKRKADEAREELQRSLDRLGVERGLVRAIGVTGHGAQIAATHRRSLQRFDFDSVLLPYNYTTVKSEYYGHNFDALQATCRERNTAVQTIKSMAYRPWMGRPRSASTWYEPLDDPADIQQALDWALGRPGIFVISSGDVNLLPKILDAAEQASHQRPTDADMERMVERLKMEPLFV
ncbi:MAG: aldo/keto reductase [Chloroflexi bacterium]|nr:aldo/keto reductase [Chloroflexota bacterium]